MVKKKRLFSLLLVICLVASSVLMSSCDSSSDKEKFGLITWDVDASDDVIKICGFEKGDYDISIKTIASLENPIEDPYSDAGMEDFLQRKDLLANAINDLAEQGCKAIALQFDDSYTQMVNEVLNGHRDLTVFILNKDGTEVVSQQEGNAGTE